MGFVGVVLAGGKSSRMGTDKARLQLSGQTMLHRTRDMLLAAGAEEVLINRNLFEPGFVPDIYPNCGPLSGIHAAAFARPNRALLCVPVDMPLLTVHALKLLASTADTHRCSVSYLHHCLPVFFSNTRVERELLEQTLTTSDNFSVRLFATDIKHCQIVARDEQVLFNSNTLSQWQQVKNFFS